MKAATGINQANPTIPNPTAVQLHQLVSISG